MVHRSQLADPMVDLNVPGIQGKQLVPLPKNPALQAHWMGSIVDASGQVLFCVELG